MRRGAIGLCIATSLSGCTAIFGLDAPDRARALDSGVRLDAAVDSLAPDTTLDAGPDAMPTCPLSYTITVASSVTRYRLVSVSATFGAHHTTCKADQPGITHLASLDTVAEIDDIRAIMGSATAFAGGVQILNSAQPDVGWLTFNGSALPTTRWITLPDDTDGVENNQQNVVVINMNGLGDRFVTDMNLGLCECDFVSIPPNVESNIQGS